MKTNQDIICSVSAIAFAFTVAALIGWNAIVLAIWSFLGMSLAIFLIVELADRHQLRKKAELAKARQEFFNNYWN